VRLQDELSTAAAGQMLAAYVVVALPILLFVLLYVIDRPYISGLLQPGWNLLLVVAGVHGSHRISDHAFVYAHRIVKAGTMSAVTLVSPSTLLTVSGIVAACCALAALALLRHLSRMEARLRAVEAVAVQPHTPATWLAGAERLASRLAPKYYQRNLQRRLERAQLAERFSPAQLLLLAVAFGAIAAALTSIVAGSSAALLLFPGYIVLAALLSGVWLDRRAARRRQAVLQSLPATLDLLVLAMEAGLSLDAAIREVVAEWHSAAGRELERVATLTQFGMNRGEALRQIADTLDLETLRRLAGRVGSAERLGSSLVLILRAEAEEARRERRTVASRKIAQAPTKILIPTALLILPVTLIVRASSARAPRCAARGASRRPARRSPACPIPHGS